MRKANRIITILIFIFLYIPMAVLIVASFNTGKDITSFDGFTLRQYERLFQDRSLLTLLGNSLIVSVLARAIATMFGKHMPLVFQVQQSPVVMVSPQVDASSLATVAPIRPSVGIILHVAQVHGAFTTLTRAAVDLYIIYEIGFSHLFFLFN